MVRQWRRRCGRSSNGGEGGYIKARQSMQERGWPSCRKLWRCDGGVCVCVVDGLTTSRSEGGGNNSSGGDDGSIENLQWKQWRG